MKFRLFYKPFSSGRKVEAAEIEAVSRQAAENQILRDNPSGVIVGGFFIGRE